uniref:Uncharacterized protein n=1 Tax=Phaeocystis antarctica TaxID=33657 RepID=A0A7S0HLH0_9EUKA
MHMAARITNLQNLHWFVRAAMCNDRSWKTCSIATIVFSSLLMLGMFIGVGVMNAMFGENMRCYRDVNSNDAPAPSPPGYVQCGTSRGNYILADSGARDCTGCGEAILSYDACLTAARSGTTAHYDSPEPSAALGKSENWDGPPGCQIRDEGSNFQFNANMDGASARVGYTPVCLISSSRREMFEEMHHIAAQHPSGDGVARVKLALSNIAHTFGLGPAIKQLPAVLALSPEGRKLTEAIPNDDSCGIWASDGDCDDNFLCDCGTDVTDCGFRSSTSDCSYRSKTVDESVEEIEKAVLDVFNPCIIVPAIVCALFLYLGSGLTLCKPACGGMAVLICGAVFSLLSLPIFSIMVFIYLFYANILIEIYKTSFNFGGDCSGSAAESNFCKCIDDSQAMFSSAGVGCLIACIGCLGAFISAICASCGICKAQKKAKAASLPGPGTQMGAVQGVVQAVAVAQPMAVAQPL